MRKGNKSWTPSNLGDIINKEEGFRYRRVRNDKENVAKKREEGWEFVSGVNGAETKAIHPLGRPDEPNQLTSNVEGRDWILMRIDEESAKERDSYFNKETSRRETRIYAESKSELSKSNAPIHGNITKERKGVRTVI